MDSVDRELAAWTSAMPAADQDVEAARQRIGRLSRLFERVLEPIAAGHGLSLGDLTTLSALGRASGACTPTELARALGVTSGSLSTRLNRLSKAGLIEPADDGVQDARSRPVQLTKAGRTRWTKATTERVDAEKRLVRDALSREQLSTLNDSLAALLEGLETALGEAPRHDNPR